MLWVFALIEDKYEKGIYSPKQGKCWVLETISYIVFLNFD